jgi:hypothetical protein
MEVKEYPPNDDVERRAVALLNYLFDTSVIKSDINVADKVPHHDGEIELVDSESRPIGKFNVQVKKMPEDFKDRYGDCPVELIEYSKRLDQALIFIGVDSKNKKAYWKQIDPKMIELLKKPDQKTITLVFDIEKDVIEEGNSLYITRWKELILARQQQREDLLKLKHFVSETIGLESMSGSDKIMCQKHVDLLNKLLSSEFEIIKKDFLPNVWKLGLAVHDINDESLIYDYFSKPYGSTVGDVLSLKGINLSEVFEQDKPQSYIAKIVKDDHVKVLKTGFVRKSLFDPENAAKRFALNLTEKALDKQIFDSFGDTLCAEEIMFFMDRYSSSIGIEKSTHYALKEIEDGIRNYLPTWFHLAVEEMSKIQNSRLVFLDSFEILAGFQQDVGLIKEQDVQSKIGKINSPFSVAILTYRPIKQLLHDVDYLISKKVTEVQSPYEISRSGVFNFEELERNVKKILDVSGNEYREFVKGNGLNGLANASHFGDRYSYVYLGNPVNWKEGSVTITEFQLENQENSLPKTQYLNENLGDFQFDFAKKQSEVVYCGKTYNVASFAVGFRNNLIGQKPLKSQIYSMLAEDLKEVYGITNHERFNLH